MSDVVIGKGKLAGKGVYAARDFKEKELVMSYRLKELTQDEFNALPISEHMFTHSFWGKIYLYPEPARYVNHSAKPNTRQDFKMTSDYAIRPIKKGELITTNGTVEIQNELKTFLEIYEEASISGLHWLKIGYRNAVCSYTYRGVKKVLTLKRINGNWRVMNEHLSKKT